MHCAMDLARPATLRMGRSPSVKTLSNCILVKPMKANVIISLLLLCLFGGAPALCQSQPTMLGRWELLPALSSDIDHFRGLTLELREEGKALILLQTWRSRVNIRDSLALIPGGEASEIRVTNWVVPGNVFMGLRMVEGSTRRISGAWEEGGRILRLEDRFLLRGSQGEVPVTVLHRFELSQGEEILTYRVERSTRKVSGPVTYYLKRAGTREAFCYRMEDNWEIAGKLPLNALMISLQGVVNKRGPLLYLLYPDNWPFTYVQSVYEFYQRKRYYSFRELKTPAEAVMALRSHLKGYVVWDPSVRTSLVVAFTVAGLEDAIVITPELLPLAQAAGLNVVEDFRGTFAGMNDAQIYRWAYRHYWDRCSREFIVWLGGEAGKVMKPAVADWGMHQRVFFNDLSSRPSDSAEYALANQLLAEMKPMSMVMGWHSYAKDLEEEHVKLTSTYGHRVEGLNTLPNLSFSAQVPISPGFTFKNHHHVQLGDSILPGPKVYITCVQTDGIGLGAWLRPGRGEIPYAWEVLMNYTWMAPAMAEYFYTMATPNDYFIGCLSGPGYLYPKAVPPPLLSRLIARAAQQMKILDLRVFETMDWSEGSEVEGNTDLTGQVVDQYYQGMPEAIGFLNGYGPGYTFTVRDRRPLVSYDYYLSPVRPEDDAVADLKELAAINARRPYFLLVHVRENSDIKRVKGILDKLGPEFEVVPLDVFLVMAGKQPTFEERVL
jgi:hypothetical protein